MDLRLDANPQLFAVLCALRAAGVTPVVEHPGSLPVTSRVEAALRRLEPSVSAPLRAYFAERQKGQEAVDLSPYISLALLLGAPPALSLNLPTAHIPPDVLLVKDLAPLLGPFYQQAGLERLWRAVLPYYDRKIAERQGRVAKTLLEARAYLRLIGDRALGRTYIIYLEALVPSGLTSARNYGQEYFLVVHPERADLLDTARHQYLHFLLDPVVAKYSDDLHELARVQPIAERAVRLPADFRHDTMLLVTESLIQGIELRLRKLPAAAASARLDEIERTGHLFARHFYYALEQFEQDEPSIRFYFPELLKGFNPGLETLRLAKVDFSAPAPEPAEGPPATPAPQPEETALRLLAEAERLMGAGDREGARERFERVLKEIDAENPSALYGLALLASAEQDREAARGYFERTLARAREPRILGWTHVYLGRIYDLEGVRDKALEHYRAALALNTRQERIEQAARRGLQHPFGESEGDPRREEF